MLQHTHRRSESVRTDVINVLELPALFNTGLSEEEVMRQTLRCVSLCHPGVHAFLLMIPDAPLNNEDRGEMEEIQKIFSSRINKHIMILIMQNSEHQTAELNEETQAVIQSFGGRHHHFSPETQVSTLMENIEQMLEENRGGVYSTETFLEAQMENRIKYEEMKNKKSNLLETPLLTQEFRVNTDDEVRIVLLGKTGVGKSTTGNTILGRKAFTAETSHQPVTKESQRETCEINGRQVTVVDTPGVFDTELTEEEIQREIRHCISMILPGPHVFLLLVPLGRFTKEEETSVKIIQETFGENSLMFTMVLFTRGDFLGNKSIEEFLGKPGSPLMNLIEACGHRYHVFNNTQSEERTQVSDLLEKIDNMVKANGGSFYSCKMFREMEREKQEQQMKILMDRVRETEEEMKKLEEEKDRMKMMMEEERQKQETERKRREEELKREIREGEEHQREMKEEMKRERETFRHEIEEIRREKEKMQIKHETETDRLMKRIEEEKKKREEENTEREEKYTRQIREKEEKEREMKEEMKREREEMMKEIEKLQLKHQTETERLMKRIEDERENHETERKRREEEFNEREERYKREMKERKEREKKICEEMTKEQEEWEKHRREEKKRREEEEKRREKEQREFNEKLKEERDRMKREKEYLQSKHEEEEKKMKIQIEELNREREELMKRHEEEKERMKMMMEEEKKRREELMKSHEEEKERIKKMMMMMMEEEQQKQEKERKRREEEFREREERYKRLIKEREQKENELIEQIKLEQMRKQELEERLRREREKQKSEHTRLQRPVSDQTAGLNVILLGKRGAGKSSSGNTILGRQAFIAKKIPKSVTRDVNVESGTFCELPVTVYDTPGLFDTKLSDEEIQQMINEKVLQKCSSGLCVFLLVIKADRFTEEDRKTVEKIEKILGEEQLKNTWILFTGGDELEEENTTIQEFIEKTEELKTLVQKYEHRYHVFNNKKKMKKDEEGPGEQVKILLTKILKPYTMGEEINPLKRKIPENIEPVSRVSSPPSRRIVIVGKSGVGKSAAGNTILGQRDFVSVMSVNSVTHECSAAQATVSGRSVSVVDTPPLFDTQIKPEELMMEIAKSVYISSPGPHAFLIVFPVNMRFTEQELQILQMIELMFGEEVLKYSIILFTHGDKLDGESVEKLIEENYRLRYLVQQCEGRYHVFNNKDVNNREQVEDLLQKIDSMIQQNGGGHYSNEMFEDAQRARQEEEEERKQQEEKQKQEEMEREIKEIEERVRAEMKAENLKVEGPSEEEQRRREKQKQEVIEREIKKIKERIRSEDQGRKQSENCVCS
ncbi:uncharacterized protein [Danio rerio]|uniref:Uncharacterized protein n=1 Tax=Danio rerio TaxID=7955 RepID=A0AC58J013_DANRE